ARAPPPPQERQAPELTATPGRELPGGLHLHFHDVSARTSPPSSSATAAAGKTRRAARASHNRRWWGARGPWGTGTTGSPGPAEGIRNRAAYPDGQRAPRPRAVLNRHRQEPRFRYTPGEPAPPPAHHMGGRADHALLLQAAHQLAQVGAARRPHAGMAGPARCWRWPPRPS